MWVETIRCLEGNMEGEPWSCIFNDFFFFTNQITNSWIKAKMDILCQTNKIPHGKGSIQQSVEQAMEGRKKFANYMSDKILIFIIYKKLKNSTTKCLWTS